MGTISVTLPSDGSTIDAADVNTPINAILSEFNGNIDNDNIKSGAAISGSKIADASITNAKLSTAVGEIGGRWQDWTPTWTNFTLGNATAVFRYMKIGRTVHCWMSIIFGSTTAVSGDVIFTLPVAADANYNNGNTHPLGSVCFSDTGTAAYSGYIGIGADDTKGVIRVFNASGTYLTSGPLSSTVPHTWASTDRIEGSFTYEAAA